ncbi:MAG: HAMP domain-containing protein [Clostridiales bacterium]|nr:HAMP domain-containing protein [Clostridiales bacterium]
MKLNLFKKYFLTTSAIILVSFAFLIVILSVWISGFLAREKRALLSETGQTISEMGANWLGEPDFVEGMSSVALVVSRSIDANIFVADASGKPYVCSCDAYMLEGSCVHTRNQISTAVMEEAMGGEYYQMGNLDGLYHKPYYTCGVPLKDKEGNPVGAVFASSPASSLKAMFNQIFRIFLFSACIPIVLMFFAVYAMTLRLTKPLRLMSEAARSMAKGDFSKRIPVESDDEIGELSIAFNQMTNSLVQLESMRRSFVANVSHELKTPMTSIGGFIDGILDGTIPPEKQSYYLRLVSDEVKRLSRLVRAMLSMAKLESGEMKINKTEFSLSEVLRTTVISFEQPIEEKRICIKGLEDMPEIRILADRDLIHQVVYNLVDNAVKFTDAGGWMQMSVEEKRGLVYLLIRNSGEGIAAKDLPRIFDRFYKTDKSRSADKSGTGLGLYLVKTIADIHGGGVTVRSNLGEFTEFEVRLPTGKPRLEEEGTKPHKSGKAKKSKEG